MLQLDELESNECQSEVFFHLSSENIFLHLSDSQLCCLEVIRFKHHLLQFVMDPLPLILFDEYLSNLHSNET